MTSGKVYEYMATGLPVVSAHEADHDASTVLTGRPLWTGARGMGVDHLADAFVEAARMATRRPPRNVPRRGLTRAIQSGRVAYPVNPAAIGSEQAGDHPGEGVEA